MRAMLCRLRRSAPLSPALRSAPAWATIHRRCCGLRTRPSARRGADGGPYRFASPRSGDDPSRGARCGCSSARSALRSKGLNTPKHASSIDRVGLVAQGVERLDQHYGGEMIGDIALRVVRWVSLNKPTFVAPIVV